MKQRLAYLYLAIVAATGLFMTACSGDDDTTTPEAVTPPADTATPTEQKTYTLTLTATNGGDITRALTEDSNGLTATWTAGETVDVYEGETKLGTLTAQTSTATSTLTGTITAPTGNALTLKYQKPDDGKQDGTLATIGSTYNYCTATTTVTKNGDSYTGTAASFVSQQAIVKFTLKRKYDSQPFTYQNYTFTCGGSPVTLSNIPNATFTTNGGNGVLYVAIPGASNANFSVASTTTTLYERSGVTFENGKYYTRTISMYDAIWDISGGSSSYTVLSNEYHLIKNSSSDYTLILSANSKTMISAGVSIEGSYDSNYAIISNANTAELYVGGTVTLKGESSSKAVSGTLKIDGTEVSGDLADGAHTCGSYTVTVSDSGNKWVITKN